MSEEQRDDKKHAEGQRALEAIAQLADDFGLPFGTTIEQVATHARYLQQERARLTVMQSAVAECKAKPHSYGGGASQEQRWHCDECGDVTDSERCPKGRVNGTLASLRAQSATARISTELRRSTDNYYGGLARERGESYALMVACDEIDKLKATPSDDELNGFLLNLDVDCNKVPGSLDLDAARSMLLEFLRRSADSRTPTDG